MTQHTTEQHTTYVRSMFTRIARRYDLMNRLMTLGQDAAWRRDAVQRLGMPPDALVLDAGAGTGEIAAAICRSRADARVVACDLTPGMMTIGRARHAAGRILWVSADAMHLPFAANRFDGVISGFLLRNVADLERALCEQQRTLKPGARLVSLDTTPPPRSLQRPFLLFHLRVIIPLLGRLIAGDAEAYRYLPASTEGFLPAERLAERMQAAGVSAVSFLRRMLGTVAIHWGEKPGDGSPQPHSS